MSDVPARKKQLMITNLSAGRSLPSVPSNTYRLAVFDPDQDAYQTNDALCEPLFALLQALAWDGLDKGEFPKLQIELV